MHDDPKTELITRDLLARGWTRSLIARFLSQPDRTVGNPHYRCAADMKLYSLARVEQIEATPEFRAARAKLAGRRAGAARATATKLQKTLDLAARTRIPTLRPLDREAVIEKACANFNSRLRQREWDWGLDSRDATPDSDPSFLARITVNYLRHKLTPYDRTLDRLAGRVGVGDACDVIRARVYEAIRVAYPWLAAECDRQEAARRQECTV